MPNGIIVPHVENELVRDYLSETKGATEHLRRYVIQLDVNISQVKDWNALHRAINDRKHKDAKQIVFGYMDKDRLDEKKIAEVVLNQLDPRSHTDRSPSAPIMEVQMIDDHRVSAIEGHEWPDHVCRFHIEVPIDEKDWGTLRDTLREAKRAEAFEIVTRNVGAEHLTDPLKAAIQAALGFGA